MSVALSDYYDFIPSKAMRKLKTKNNKRTLFFHSLGFYTLLHNMGELRTNSTNTYKELSTFDCWIMYFLSESSSRFLFQQNKPLSRRSGNMYTNIATDINTEQSWELFKKISNSQLFLISLLGDKRPVENHFGKKPLYS